MFTNDKYVTMPKYEAAQNFWFIPVTCDKVAVIDKSVFDDNAVPNIAHITANVCVASIEDDQLQIPEESTTKLGAETVAAIMTDWQIYIQRPEYHMFSEDVYPDMIDEYESEFIGSVLIKTFRSGHNPDTSWKRIGRCLDWLRTTDFYTCPASTQYHDSHAGGLLKHSLKVADRAMELAASPIFASIHLEDAVFTSLVHDWCKIGLYESYLKNVKDDVTGKWSQVTAYKYADNRGICLGHGVSSMYLVMQFFNISIDVAAAIRHHMGRWNCPDSEVNELQQANRRYPLVHLIQFADQLAIVDY